ncbi:unnamed protein product [Heligmosomoides polygyrus]|uniref:ribonuclease H n=2 Tax=Heligmosomoides polygyrus TaxID=6339 RepID=A0A183F498_HELPZ|nr:unnamed protein product [Heligmosomoides polygyrus]
MAKAGFYAVANGRKVGVYGTWDECRKQVDGFAKARISGSCLHFVIDSFRYKKFGTESEALAFIANYQVGCKQLLSTLLCDPEAWKDAPIVYTDGACSKNGRAGAKAGFGVYWGKNHEDNACGPVFGTATNNRGELLAVDMALKQAIRKKMPYIVVRTDSKLLINSMDNYMDKWKRNSWKTSFGKDVLNQDLLRSIDESASQIHVKFEYVPGHSGDAGNDAADELARRGAQMFKAK